MQKSHKNLPTIKFITDDFIIRQHTFGLLKIHIKPFKPSAAFQIEISHLICNTNQMYGFYMKCNTGMKQVKLRKLSEKGTTLIYRTVSNSKGIELFFFLAIEYVVRCAIWYFLYDLKNMKNTHRGVLILVKLQA